MTKRGEPYEADYTPENGKTIRMKRRAVYRTSGEPTPEQQLAIEKVEEMVHKSAEGQRINGDPYRVMRNAEYLGVELEEEFLVDGKWSLVPNPDILISTMQAGAL
jgi:hypothetical protein